MAHYKLTKAQCDEKLTQIEDRLTEDPTNVMLTRKIPKSWLSVLPRCDAHGYIPVVYARKDESRRLYVVLCVYYGISCGTILRGGGLCTTMLDIDKAKIKVLINDVAQNIRYRPIDITIGDINKDLLTKKVNAKYFSEVRLAPNERNCRKDTLDVFRDYLQEKEDELNNRQCYDETRV